MLCGLDHTNFVTVASLKTTILSTYAAAPWCANEAPQAANATTIKAKNFSRPLFIRHLANFRLWFDGFDPEDRTGTPLCQAREGTEPRCRKSKLTARKSARLKNTWVRHQKPSLNLLHVFAKPVIDELDDHIAVPV